MYRRQCAGSPCCGRVDFQVSGNPPDRSVSHHDSPETAAVRGRLAGLHDPSELLEGLFAHSPVPYIIFGTDGHRIASNLAYREMFGREPPPEYDVLRDEIAARSGLSELVGRAFRGEAVHTPPVWYDPKELAHIAVDDAKRVAIACNFFPLRDASGAVAYVAVAFKDVTAELAAREQAQVELIRVQAASAEKDRLAEALQRSEERLRSTLEAAAVGTWEWNIPNNSVRWSANIEQIFGLPRGSFAGTYEAWLALVHPDDRAAIQAKIATSLETHAPYEAEFRFVRPDGSSGWQSTRGYAVPGADGKAELLRGVAFDVTPRRQAQDALKMPFHVLEHMSEGVSLSDEHGTILYTNPAAERMFGYARGQLLGTLLSAHFVDASAPLLQDVRAALQSGGEWLGQLAARRRDGQPFSTRSRVTTLELEGRMHWLCVHEDVTSDMVAREREQRLADSLRESEARYRAFVSQSTEGIWRVELEQPVSTALPALEQVAQMYRYAYLAECNHAMARMYGFERADELVGKRLGDLLVQDDPRNTAYLTAFVEHGYRLQAADSHERDRDGKLRVFQNSLVGTVEQGLLVRAWGTQRDVTAEIEALQQAEAANRAKDEFLALLGHELRNPLAPIITALELMKLRDSDALVSERALVERQVKHVVRLVDDLLDVSRITRGKVSLDKKPLDLADSVAAAIELASPLLEQRAHKLTVDVPRGLLVRGDSLRLAQVLTNLLSNAAKYTEPAGSVTIRAERAGEVARIVVSDTGIGIRPEILPRVFDLFVQEQQALDRSQGGLGLGLAIVRALVELHDGRVSAHSAGAGQGSQFVIELPLLAAAPSAQVREVPRPQPAMPDGLHILVVDDNEDAADLLAGLLQTWGHDVQVAYDGPSALKLLERFTPNIALLDIGLPAMDGYELARRLRAEPQLRALRLVAVTGYGQARDRAMAERAGFDAHLVKPVTAALLSTVLGELAAPRAL
jgi:PAS domain S-box-containing protein